MIKRRKHAISKKFACPCRIIIKDAVFFPAHKVHHQNTVYFLDQDSSPLLLEFCLNNNNIYASFIFQAEANTVHHKKKSSKKLYQDFKDGKDIPMKRKVFIKFPFVHEHQNHPLGGTVRT